MLLEQYKHAIEASNIVSKTDVYGIITFVNEEFCNISGYTQEELIGANHNIVR
ncbi:MAG: PAS domain S-box protein, partial [Campylobacteraceae bacterium]|nr:PAS domain S-box protein [Campylobacteraceae bacterium]MBT4179325.1 PAS domain S-box protein [Campylobacteraceae bacterium]MBT6388278.1 PAS domain S-box protein [Campylobacteraceae bacterium]MBT6578162.1 PAS domain S-box protein [Campylobacteraceae bacterium]